MEKLINVLLDNFNIIWSTISMIIGACISFFTTYMLEKRKNKMQIQKEKLDQILIPYCNSLEQILKYGKEVKDLRSWLDTLDKPLEYLNADKRVYLSKKSRKTLEEYEKLLKNFTDDLNKNYNLVIKEYSNYLEYLIMKADTRPLAEEIHYSMKDGTTDKIKLSILNKTKTSIIYNITSVDFILMHDSDYFNIIGISLDDEIKMEWEDMQEHNSLYKSDGNFERDTAFSILDVIEKNYKNADIELNRILSNISMKTSKEDIYKNIEHMRKKIISEIDKITN